LAAHAPVDRLGWLVFIEQPTAVALEPLQESLSRTFLILIVGVLVSLMAGLALARRLTTPIRALQASASRIGAGALDQRIEVRTGDEIEALAEEFNRMSAQLRELYQGLERKVAERTQDLARALDEQTATSEVLATMSRSTSDLTPILESVLTHARRLCRAEEAFAFRFDGEVYRLQKAHGAPPELQDLLSHQAIRPGRGTLVGRVALERKPVHLVDVLADREYEDIEAQRRFGYRTLLGVPLMRDSQPIGVIGLGRELVEPFTEREIQFLTTLGGQTVIAVENVGLIQEIEEKSRQLELASQHKSEFLAHMSHELRTPLNAIIGFSDVLRERMFGPLNEKQDEYVNDILSSGHHLLSLINDVLDLAKIEAGRVELELSSIWLPEVLEGSVAVFREAALRRDIHLDLMIDPRLGPLEADERKLKQVLLNLLSNALKFTPDGGTVEVTARLLGDLVQIAVRDTGIGIALEDQARIFDAFQQVRRAGEAKEGTGLGLTLARQFVEMLGGRIWLESAPGSGSTFAFTLPARSTPGPGSGAETKRDGSRQGSEAQTPVLSPDQLGAPSRVVGASTGPDDPSSSPVVLAIDDDPMVLELIRATLTPAGYAVLGAERPINGVAMAFARRPAVVIVDLMMPGMDGFEVIERLSSDPRTAGVPILVLTAKAVTADEQDRLQPRISYLADKAAFRTSEFLEVVQHLCLPPAA
jgi:signal transduction histidine kinase/CheY-like chemotaxis protein